VSGFCDRHIDTEMRRALEVQVTDPGAAADLWARVDHDIVDRAPWLFMVNPKYVSFVSPRVGNYQFSPQWGVLADQLWVR
jgi:peptide/nickel transport system substrate-binding protein